MAVASLYGLKSRMCPVCGKRFRSNAALAEHIQTEHPSVFTAEIES